MTEWSKYGARSGNHAPDVILVARADSGAITSADHDDLKMRLNADVPATLEVASRFAGIDGDHHKQWVIDQMVRRLTGCPTILGTAIHVNGQPYTFTRLGESPEYLAWIAEYNQPGYDDWDEGIAP